MHLFSLKVNVDPEYFRSQTWILESLVLVLCDKLFKIILH